MEAETNKIKSASEVLQALILNKNESAMSKREIILTLKKDIVAARAAGKTWKEIIDALQSVGINVTAQHVKACITTAQNKSKTKKKKEKSNSNEKPAKEKIIDTVRNGYTAGTGQNKIRPDSEIL